MSDWLQLHSSRFTTTAAFVRELAALLESSTYKFEVRIKASEKERLDNEFENFKTMGRLKVRLNG